MSLEFSSGGANESLPSQASSRKTATGPPQDTPIPGLNIRKIGDLYLPFLESMADDKASLDHTDYWGASQDFKTLPPEDNWNGNLSNSGLGEDLGDESELFRRLSSLEPYKPPPDIPYSQTYGFDYLTRSTKVPQVLISDSSSEELMHLESKSAGASEVDPSVAQRLEIGNMASPDTINRFACPFRKHDPERYNLQSYSRCVLTGHENIARVKNHLDRVHYTPQCVRCKVQFKREEDLDQHIQRPEACLLSEDSILEGFNQIARKAMRSRVKNRGATNADRWNDIYRLLFPGDAIPSPFFEPIHELRDYEQYARKELPRVVQQRLERLIMEEGLSESDLCFSTNSMIKDCQDSIFASYFEKVIQPFAVEVGPYESTSDELTTPVTHSALKDLVDHYERDVIGAWERNSTSFLETPSLTTGTSISSLDYEEGIGPSFATIVNTVFPCFAEGCAWLGTPTSWWDSKHWELVHASTLGNDVWASSRKIEPGPPAFPITVESGTSEVAQLDVYSPSDYISPAKEVESCEQDDAKQSVHSLIEYPEYAVASNRGTLDPFGKATKSISSLVGGDQQDKGSEIVEPILQSLIQSRFNNIVQDTILNQVPENTDADSSAHNSPSSTASSFCQSKNTSISTTSISGTSKKRSLTDARRGSGSNDDKDDNGDSGRPRKVTRHPGTISVSRRYICPFRASDPAKYGFNNPRYFSCATGSWPDLSHLKDSHIFRVHHLKCNVCKKDIEDESDYQDHLQTSNCDEESFTDLEGISEGEIKRLKDLKRPKWEDIFNFLCPNAASTPTPWFIPLSDNGSHETAVDEEDLRRMVNTALPSEIADILAAKIEPLLRPFYDEVLSRREEILNCATERLRQRFAPVPTLPDEGLGVVTKEPLPQIFHPLADEFDTPFGGSGSVDTSYLSNSLFPDLPSADEFFAYGMLEQLDLPSVADTVPDSVTMDSPIIDEKYKEGWTAGHREGFQEGQRVGYEAGANVASRFTR